ncbi:hypothetical protein IV203_010464 [Nitzschia inconspicua]|uniref:Uncharacterized protein n=1 Tax=Nitzschia inconspicua TaxID=303405 RepID=A0A9K3PN37_9STRA|nr:hypothetical protein IV203_010464 [Nitzschia inconspicua]
MNQISSFTSLAVQSGGGFNPKRNLTDLIDCTLTEGCFADPEQSGASAFIECYIFNGILTPPPCEDEFTAVASNVNFSQILLCINGGDDEPEASLSPDFRELLGDSIVEVQWDQIFPGRGLQLFQGQNLLPDSVINVTASGDDEE